MKKETKILLINPNIRPTSRVCVIPVGLACIATALSNAGFRPDILDIDLYRYTDEEVSSFLDTHEYDIVGFGTMISAFRQTRELARKIKRAMPDTLLVVGNTVATAIPEKLLAWVPEIDIAVIGEGDVTIVEIVHNHINKGDWQNVKGIALKNKGTLCITEKRPVVADITDIPFPDYSLFEFSKYLEVSNMIVGESSHKREMVKALPLNTARGCPYSCTFCAHAFKGERYRYYPWEMVLEHTKKYQEKFGINYLSFWDELSFSSVKRTEEFCRLVEEKEMNISWDVASRGGMYKAKDLALLERCRNLGAVSISGALESSSPEILKAMNKRLNLNSFIEQMETGRKAGLVPRTGMVFGYPQETRQTIRDSIDVCRRVGIYPSSGFALALPGTELYRYALENGIIVDEMEYLLRIGDRQDLHVNLTKMSDQELFNTVKEELIRLKDDLGIPLKDEDVIKTTCYRQSRRN